MTKDSNTTDEITGDEPTLPNKKKNIITRREPELSGSRKRVLKQASLKRFEDLKGCILSAVNNVDDEVLLFTLDSGEAYILHHRQSCCESVLIDDIIGDLENLVGSPILMAEEAISKDVDPLGHEWDENKYRNSSFTWTFYRLATVKGYVTICWYGASNGYYSESVDWYGPANRYPGE